MTPRAPQPRPHLLRNISTTSKLSLPSSSQSNEADDEQSLSDDSSDDMESTLDSPQYDGEDTRLTSDKELSGFYMYGWAAEVCLQFFFITTLVHMIHFLIDSMFQKIPYSIILFSSALSLLHQPLLLPPHHNTQANVSRSS